MKRMKKCTLLLAFIALTGCLNTIQAQDITQDVAAFVKLFEKHYNMKDDKALKEMYTKDAVRIGIDGKTTTGNEAIREVFADFFKDDTRVKLTQEKAELAADGSIIATGTYHVTGTSAKAEKINRIGNYNNTMIKVNGEWKISKNVLTPL